MRNHAKEAGKLRRAIISPVMVLLLLSSFAFIFTVQPARAQSEGTIIINPDGSISSPVTANITVSNNAYTFNGSNYLPVVVDRSNIIIDGMGHTLQAPGNNGFSLSGMSDVTIKNTTIINSTVGIYLNSSSANDILSDNNVIANSEFGICLDSCDNNTLSGNKVTTNHDEGIWLYSSNNNTLSGNNVTANRDTGIGLIGSSDNVLSGNDVTANSQEGIGGGIAVWFSSNNNTLSGNSVAANGYGIWLSSSSGNVLSGNVMTCNNLYGNLGVYSLVLSDFVNHINTSNLVNGKPVYYLMNQSNVMINPETYPEVGYLGLINCKNVTVQGFTFTENGEGLLLANTTDSKITGNNVTANVDGIVLYYSSGDVLSGNNISNISDDGVDLYSSSNCTVSGNNITGSWTGIKLDYSSDNVLFSNNLRANSEDGINLYTSSNNVLVGNNVANNSYAGISLAYNSSNCVVSGSNITGNSLDGVDLSSSNCTVSGNNITNNGVGVDLVSSSSCSISGNNIANNSYDGVSLIVSSYCTVSGSNITGNSDEGVYLYYCSNCSVSGNNIANNAYGVFFISSSGNRFFHNNFINNTQQASSDGSPNTWDNGYPSGGNYWSNYQMTYPSAVENDSSAIWNTPYVIDTNNTDTYPLMGPLHTFKEGAWNNTSYYVDVVSNSTITNFNFSAHGSVTPQLPFMINFTVATRNGTIGFCRVTIPKELTSIATAGWAIEVNYTLVVGSINETNDCTYIYFTYPPGTATIILASPKPVPEFQPFMLLPLFMIITLLGAMILKRRRNVKK
jgi:parallel beta-helix repeat protein